MFPVALLTDLPDPGLRSVALPNGDRVVLIRRGATVTALTDECSHQAMPLSAGDICADGTVECPWHGARFDATTGVCRRGPAMDDVASYEVRIEDGRVLVGERQPVRD
jgi:3-phenylpropionate/trans-cinnamate dioxygenase ferredoxin component